METMGDLHRGSVCIAVCGNYFHTEPLEFDGYFLAEFARTQKKRFL